MSKKTLIKNQQKQAVSVPAGSRSASRKTSQLGERFDAAKFVPNPSLPVTEAAPPVAPPKARRATPGEAPKKSARLTAVARPKRKPPGQKKIPSTEPPVFLQAAQQDRLSHLRERNIALREQLVRLSETRAKRPKN